MAELHDAHAAGGMSSMVGGLAVRSRKFMRDPFVDVTTFWMLPSASRRGPGLAPV
jgi:hypothetical protein